MAEWYKIRLLLPSGVSEETKELICTHFLEKDYDFPRECINGESAYRNPQLSPEVIIQDLYEKFKIDEAKLQFAFTEDDLDERYEVYSYKSLFWKNAEKKKVFTFIEEMIIKYELTTRSKVRYNLSITKNNTNSSKFNYSLYIYFYFISDGVEYESRYSKYTGDNIESDFKEIEGRFEKLSKILNVIDTVPYTENFEVNNYD